MKLFILITIIFCSTQGFCKETGNRKSVTEHYAQQMNICESTLRIPELYDAVDEWIGTPYRYGRNDKKGTDCSGLVRNILHNFLDEELPRSAAGLAGTIKTKPVDELKEGDLVFFNYRGRTNSHVGIYLQNGWFVHASTVSGVTLANIHTGFYKKRFSKGGNLDGGNLEDIIHTKMEERNNKFPALKPLSPLYINYLEYKERITI